MKRRNLVLVAALLLCGGAFARADETRMTLSECLDRALASALEIQVGRFGPPISSTRVVEADSEFDHLLSFRAQGGQTREPATSFFSGADTVRQQTFGASANLGRRTRDGTTLGLGFGSNHLLSNSQFFSFRPQWTNTLSFSVTQPLLRGAWREFNESRTRLAESDVRVAVAEYRAVVEGTLANVERAYWRLVFLRGDNDLRRQSLETARELMRVAKKRLEAGAGTRIELVQAEAGVAERDKELITAEAALRNGEDLLRSYVLPFATEPDREIRIVPSDRIDTIPAVPPVSVDDRLRRAFEVRPDVVALKERLEASGIRVLQAENELLPKLDVFGSVDLMGVDDGFFDALHPIRGADFPGWEIGLALEFPLGNRSAEARHRRAVLERSRTVASFESLKNQVVLDVRTTARAVDTAMRQIDATRKATAAAQAQFEAEQDRVRAEKSTNYQVLQVEDDLSRARTQELLALVGYRAALVAVEQATGTYLESRGLVPPPATEDAEEDGEGDSDGK